jgi:hypothetical protein
MARALAFLTLFGCCGLLAHGAQAEPTAIRLEVMRAPGSEQCPDASQILSAAAALFPNSALRAASESDFTAPEARVLVEPVAGGHQATVRVGARRPGERRIVDSDEQCRGLAEALAVALAVQVAPTAVPVPDAQPRPEPAKFGPLARPPERRVIARAGVELGALGGFGLLGKSDSAGVLEEPAFGGAFGASLWAASGLGLRLRVARALSSEATVSPGIVKQDLWALFAAGCFRWLAAPRVALAPCVEVGWGRQQATSEGLAANNGSASRRWVVVAPSLTLSVTVAKPLALSATAGLSGRLHEQSYSVDGEVVLRQPGVGSFLLVGIEALWPIFDSPAARPLVAVSAAK